MSSTLAPIDWFQPDAFEQWEARCAAERALTTATGKTAMERACEEVERRVRPVVLDALDRREARRIEVEADRIAAKPMLLTRIPDLPAWSSPKLIIAFCESLLENGHRGVTRLRLLGAIAYARREMAAEAGAAA